MSYTPTSWAAWGNAQEAQPGVYESYPSSLFVAEPTLVVNATNCAAGIYAEIWHDGSATRTPVVFALRPGEASAGTSVSLKFACHAIGKWTTTASSINKFYSWKRTA